MILRAATVDALAFKKILDPRDSSLDPIPGDALLPLAKAKLRCDGA